MSSLLFQLAVPQWSLGTDSIGAVAGGDGAASAGGDSWVALWRWQPCAYLAWCVRQARSSPGMAEQPPLPACVWVECVCFVSFWAEKSMVRAM